MDDWIYAQMQEERERDEERMVAALERILREDSYADDAGR